MNGQPLPVNHGFPIRIIAPGIAGARSVKWLDRITVQTDESENYYQHYDYKVLPPEATDAEAAKNHWHSTPAIQDMPVNSVIAVPQSGETLSSSADIVVEGYALPQGDQGPVKKVEVSTDNGKTWTDAKILSGTGERERWCWTLWRATVTFEKGEGRQILSRATDAGGNVQSADAQWNLRGVAYNGYGIARDLQVT